MIEDKGIIIKNIFYMLSYAFQELRKNTYESISIEKFDNIYDLFAEIIAKGVSQQLKQGLHRSYIEEQDSIPTLRGKLNLPETIRHKVNQRQLLECEFDEYSPDNLFNQILKSTVLLLISSTDVKPERKKLLRKILPYFSDIQEINLKTVKWRNLRFDRNSKTYQMLLYLCYFVVQELLLTTDEGKFKQQKFSDDRMCRLFEKFVLEYYKKHHPEFKPTAKQIEWNLDKEKSPGINLLPLLKTDVFLTINDRTLIIDTKYYSKIMVEHYDKKSIAAHNQQQIFTYVVNHDRKHEGKTDGMLLYAKTQEEVQPDDMVTISDGNRLYYKNLDLNQDFEGIKSQLESFLVI